MLSRAKCSQPSGRNFNLLGNTGGREDGCLTMALRELAGLHVARSLLLSCECTPPQMCACLHSENVCVCLCVCLKTRIFWVQALCVCVCLCVCALSVLCISPISVTSCIYPLCVSVWVRVRVCLCVYMCV